MNTRKFIAIFVLGFLVLNPLISFAQENTSSTSSSSSSSTSSSDSSSVSTSSSDSSSSSSSYSSSNSTSSSDSESSSSSSSSSNSDSNSNSDSDHSHDHDNDHEDNDHSHDHDGEGDNNMYLPDMPVCSGSFATVISTVPDNMGHGITSDDVPEHWTLLPGPSDSGDNLDYHWLDIDGDGNYGEWDFGKDVKSVRVYAVMDHGPYPDEFNEYKISVSSDGSNWIPVSLSAPYFDDINNVRTHDGAKDYASTTSFRYVRVYPSGIAGTDTEIDALQSCDDHEGGGHHPPTNHPPVINLLGANPFELTVNHVFVDPGATASDTEDGDLTSHIIETGSVNASTTGTYILTYSVTDSGGASASAMRTVDVVDASSTSTNFPPMITLLGDNPLHLLIGSTFTDPGATATDTEDGDLTSHIIVSGSVDTSTTSTSTLIYSVTDSGGLTASTTRSVIVDATTTDSGSTTTPPVDNGGGSGGGSNSGGSGSGSSSGGGNPGGHRHDISSLIASSGSSSGVGQVLGATCPYLNDYLHIGWNNSPTEVMKVQSFLNIYEGENVAVSGFFDQATFDAVSRFQNKYFDDILRPWGHTAPTGFVYILTKKKINEIYCNTTITLTAAQQQEIASFHAYLDSLKNNTGGSAAPAVNLGDYVGTTNNGSSNSSSTLGSIVDNTKAGAAIVATTVQEGIKGGINKIVKNDNLKNLAVSLFGVPKGLNHLSSTYLLIALAIIIAIALGMRRAGAKKPRSIMVLETKKGPTKNKVDEDKKPEVKNESKPIITSEPKIESKPETQNESVDDKDKTDKGFKGIIG